MKKKLFAAILAMGAVLISGCGAVNVNINEGSDPAQKALEEDKMREETTRADSNEVTKNGEIYILYTSDIHCGVDQGFGLAGLYEYRKELEELGYTTILVDDGDSVQGGSIGILTGGEAVIRLMNKMEYDVAVPGNHDFDYGMDQFMNLVEMADFPFICCNFTKEGENVFAPYIIIEAEGKKIAFVGVTTPETITSSTPAIFQDKNGRYVYDFMQDDDGTKLYETVQKAVDDARGEGADYVYVMGHMGLNEVSHPYTYADVISHTSGIDVFLDGHSHDTEQVVMKNKDGDSVVRSAVGTKMNSIGYSHITDEGIKETEILTWTNKISLPSMIGLDNPISAAIAQENAKLDEVLEKVVAKSDIELTINDPEETDLNGVPVRMVRRAETNLADLVADAFRIRTGADIGMVNGGGVRQSIQKGDITYGDIISVMPFNNSVCVIEATGQQIMDALEWGARAVPDESGGFLHVSGLTYEIDSSIDSPCTFDVNSMMTGISGNRRVKNVKVADKPIDPEGKYRIAGIDYPLIKHGDGHTSFDDATILIPEFGTDNQMLIDYITDELGGVVGEEYADPYGSGRIVITE